MTQDVTEKWDQIIPVNMWLKKNADRTLSSPRIDWQWAGLLANRLISVKSRGEGRMVAGDGPPSESEACVANTRALKSIIP